MVCLRAMGLQRRREKDHAPRKVHLVAVGTADKTMCEARRVTRPGRGRAKGRQRHYAELLPY